MTVEEFNSIPTFRTASEFEERRVLQELKKKTKFNYSELALFECLSKKYKQTL